MADTACATDRRVLEQAVAVGLVVALGGRGVAEQLPRARVRAEDRVEQGAQVRVAGRWRRSRAGRPPSGRPSAAARRAGRSRSTSLRIRGAQPPHGELRRRSANARCRRRCTRIAAPAWQTSSTAGTSSMISADTEPVRSASPSFRYSPPSRFVRTSRSRTRRTRSTSCPSVSSFDEHCWGNARLGDRRMTRSAFITGGGGGLGVAVVERFLTAGWNVTAPRRAERRPERPGSGASGARGGRATARGGQPRRRLRGRRAGGGDAGGDVRGEPAAQPAHDLPRLPGRAPAAGGRRRDRLHLVGDRPRPVRRRGRLRRVEGRRASRSPRVARAPSEGVRCNVLLPSRDRHAGQPRVDARSRASTSSSRRSGSPARSRSCASDASAALDGGTVRSEPGPLAAVEAIARSASARVSRSLRDRVERDPRTPGIRRAAQARWPCACRRISSSRAASASSRSRRAGPT